MATTMRPTSTVAPDTVTEATPLVVQVLAVSGSEEDGSSMWYIIGAAGLILLVGICVGVAVLLWRKKRVTHHPVDKAQPTEPKQGNHRAYPNILSYSSKLFTKYIQI